MKINKSIIGVGIVFGLIVVAWMHIVSINNKNLLKAYAPQPQTNMWVEVTYADGTTAIIPKPR
jgi:hypothetical protein